MNANFAEFWRNHAMEINCDDRSQRMLDVIHRVPSQGSVYLASLGRASRIRLAHRLR